MAREAMTGKERVMAAFNGQPYDRMPLINPTSICNTDCMAMTKAYYPDAHYNSSQMVALAAASHEILKYDSVMPCFSVCAEAISLGCDVSWGSLDTIPYVRSGPLHSMDQFSAPANYLDRKHIRVVLNAIKKLKSRYQDKIVIIGKVVAATSLAFYLYGVQNMLTSIVLEPEKVRHFVARVNELVIAYAVAQIEMGADIVTISDDASGDLVTRDTYEYIAMEANTVLNKAIQKGARSIYHLSGCVTEKLHLMDKSGFDAMNLDTRNSIPTIKSAVSSSTKLVGGINGPLTLLNGTAEEIRREVLFFIRSGVHMMSPESSTSCRVPNKSHAVIYNTLKQYYDGIYFGKNKLSLNGSRGG